MARYRPEGPLVYVDQFLRLPGAAGLIERRLFPNSKEISESMAVWFALRGVLIEHGGLSQLGRRDALAVVPGDGTTPKTAALMAATSAWKTLAIDPRLRPRQWDLERVECDARMALPERLREQTRGAGLVAVLMVHSHAELGPLYDAIEGPKLAVALPCCVPSGIDREPDRRFRDEGIASPANQLEIWVDLD